MSASESGSRLAASSLRARWLGKLLLLLPALLVWLLYLALCAMGSRLERQQVLQQFHAIAAKGSTHLALRLEATRNLIESFALRYRFREQILARDGEACRKHLEQILTLDPEIDRVLIADPEGRVFADAPQDAAVKGLDVSFRDWFRGALELRGLHISEPYQRFALDRPFVVAVSVPCLIEGRPIGVLSVQYRLETLCSWLAGLVDILPEAEMFLIGKDARIVAHSARSTANGPAELPAGALRIAIDSSPDPSFEGVPYSGARAVLASYQEVPRTPWKLVVMNDHALAFQRVGEVKLRLAVISVLLFLTILALMLIGKRHEARLARMAHEMEQKNRELESLVYTVSHDLKAPLVGLHGLAAILREDYGERLDATATQYLSMMQDSANRMRDLIDDILKFSRIGSTTLRKGPVPMRELIERVVTDLGHSIRKREIQVDLTGEFPTLYSSEVGLYEVFLNLIGNAAKFMGDQPNPRIEIGCREAGAVFLFWVRDNGIGIDEKFLGKIFNPFSRLQEVKAEGSGVGLAIVTKIVERLEGTIRVESAKGQGTTFHVELPASSPPDAPVRRSDEEPP